MLVNILQLDPVAGAFVMFDYTTNLPRSNQNLELYGERVDCRGCQKVPSRHFSRPNWPYILGDEGAESIFGTFLLKFL